MDFDGVALNFYNNFSNDLFTLELTNNFKYRPQYLKKILPDIDLKRKQEILELIEPDLVIDKSLQHDIRARKFLERILKAYDSVSFENDLIEKYNYIISKEFCCQAQLNDLFKKLEGKNLAELINMLFGFDDQVFQDLHLFKLSKHKHNRYWLFADQILIDRITNNIVFIELKTTDKYDVFQYLHYLILYSNIKSDSYVIRTKWGQSEEKNKLNNVYHLVLHPRGKSTFVREKDWLIKNDQQNHYTPNIDVFKNLIHQSACKNNKKMQKIADQLIEKWGETLFNLNIYSRNFDELHSVMGKLKLSELLSISNNLCFCKI